MAQALAAATRGLGEFHSYASILKELDAELQAAHGLPLSSFEMLVQLDLAPEGRASASGLA